MQKKSVDKISEINFPYITELILPLSQHSLLCIVCLISEPPYDKTNKMACAPGEDSDQPGHPPSLTRVFAVRMKKAWVLSYPLNAQ